MKFKKLHTGLNPENAKRVAEHLNLILSNEYVLYTKTLNFHWNLKGPDFYALHKFLEDQYNQLLDIVDDVAERVQQVGHTACGTLTEFLDRATISDAPQVHNDELALIAQLLDDHETIIRQIRETIPLVEEQYDDLGTGNFLTDLMETHEKMAWILRSFFSE